jgi:hypothetical protein
MTPTSALSSMADLHSAGPMMDDVPFTANSDGDASVLGGRTCLEQETDCVSTDDHFHYSSPRNILTRRLRHSWSQPIYFIISQICIINSFNNSILFHLLYISVFLLFLLLYGVTINQSIKLSCAINGSWRIERIVSSST